MSFTTLIVGEQGDGPRRTGLITLNRPQQLNALNDVLMDELGAALTAFDADDAIASIVITGSEKAFSAGADIAVLATMTMQEAYGRDIVTRNWETIRGIRKPVIAAVAGVAIGGGCELMMMCDIVIAADNARFGQPELQLGVIPGAGGTQRLPRAIGKAKAMDMILTGRLLDAAEAERAGLVSRVVPLADLMPTALASAEAINALSGLSVMMAKESVNRAFEGGLSEGILVERRLFQSLYGTEDQKEGMAAFLEKRKPAFRQR